MNILWVTDYLFRPSPRNIRALSLAGCLVKWSDVTVISKDLGHFKDRALPFGFELIKSPLTDRLYSAAMTPAGSATISNRVGHVFFKLAAKCMSKVVFPDIARLDTRKYMRTIERKLASGKPHCVILSVRPYSMYVLADVLRRRFRDLKIILDIGDPFWENSADDKHKRKPKAIIKLEGNALNAADSVFVTNEATKKHFMKNYSQFTDCRAIHVVPNGVLDRRKQGGSANSSRSKAGSFKLVYAGVFYKKLRNPDSLYRAIHSMSGDVRLDIYGPETKLVRQPMVDGNRVRYVGMVSNERIYDVYDQADMLVHIDNAFGAQESGKIFELISARKPLLFIGSDENSAVLKIAEDYPATVVSRNIAEEIVLSIRYAMSNTQSFKYDFDITPYLWSARAASFMKHLEHLRQGSIMFGQGY